MPHDTQRPDDMATSNNSHSFTNGSASTTADRKSNGSTNGLGSSSGFGTTNVVWGAQKNIWSYNDTSNGLANGNYIPMTAKRDSSASRDGAIQLPASNPGVIERQTGSKSLADSSISDVWSQKTPAMTKRSTTTTRSSSYTQATEPTAFQQRSISNAGLPTPFSATQANPPPMSWKPQPIDLSVGPVAYSRNPFHSSFTHGPVPNVYTKFDRPTDPNSRVTDPAENSALAYSPTDTRGSGFSAQASNRNFSQGPSRDSSTQSSRLHTPLYSQPDCSVTSYRPTQSNSRAPSMSSQYNADCNSLDKDLDAVTQQLHTYSMNGNSRPTSSQRALSSSNGAWPNQSASNTNGLPAGRAPWGSIDPAHYEDSVEFMRRVGTTFGYNNPFPDPHGPHGSSVSATALSQPRGPLPHTPNAPIFTPGQPYVGAIALPTSDSSLRSLSYGYNPSSLQQNGHRTPVILDHALMVDPGTNHLVPAARLPNYGAYNSYGMLPQIISVNNAPCNGLQLSPADHLPQQGDGSVREDYQSVLLYEFRSNPKGRRYELKDIYHHVAEFSGDQHGSRFIQTKLETANSDEKQQVFLELEHDAYALMRDVFGNYVVQKFFEHGDQLQKKLLAVQMKGFVLELTTNMYGCRVVQKALDVVLSDQQADIISELKGHVITCVQNQNGNHVIQKAIEKCRPEHLDFIFKAFQGEVRSLSTHAYGCRVIQRCLERCDDEYKRNIMLELMDGIESMVMDSFGNYVVQHIVEHDKGEGRRRVLDIVARNLEIYSKHKFASNVVEVCLMHADDAWKRNIWLAIVRAPLKASGAEGDGMFVALIKDLFGNYVIQKLLDTLGQDDYHQFVDYLQPALMHAKRTGGSSCTKQVQVIEKKLHDRAKKDRDEQTKRAVYNPNAYRAPIGTPHWRNNPSTTHTPSPPPPHHFRQAPSNMPSSHLHNNLNGDATEGASAYNTRRSNGYSTENFPRQ